MAFKFKKKTQANILKRKTNNKQRVNALQIQSQITFIDFKKLSHRKKIRHTRLN